MTKEQIKQKAEAEADKVIIGSGMDRASVIHLKHLLVTMYMQGATEATKELEKENAELKAIERMALYSKLLDQLTKAKEIITKIMQRIPNFKAKSFQDLSLLNALSEAEQFLIEVEK